MKILRNSAFLVVAIATLLSYSGCDKPEPGPSIEEEQLAKLSGTWTVVGAGTNVTLDAVSKKTDYATFELTLTGTPGATSFGYTTANRPTTLSPWPSSGTWEFGESPETMINRDPDKPNEVVAMTYSVSDTQLQIVFNFAGAGYSRTKVVTGEWVFTMAKKP
jgi:hypothetical protein